MSAAHSIVLASGGTGGHMFPAAALAGVLLARGHRLALFSDTRGTAYRAMPEGVETFEVSSASPAGGLDRKIAAALNLLRGFWQARTLLRRLSPAVVVGFGGYASVPTLGAAVVARYPVVIHEQNAILGRANRLCAGAAAMIAASFDRVAALPRRMVERGKIKVTGNPVRAEIAAIANQAYRAPGLGETMNVLVLGGSQGATVFSNVVPAAVQRLPAPLRARIRVHQQCRAEDLDRVRAAYAEIRVSAVLANFFDDVPAKLAGAHLVIARAGASTVAELTAAGRPSILVPYPHAMDDHQRFNARALTDAGAAWLSSQDSFTAEWLADLLTGLLDDPAPLESAARKAHALGHADAAEKLADLVEAVVMRGGTS